MATLTSHLLSAVDGRHAAHVHVCIVQRTPGKADVELARATSDDGGRVYVDFQPVEPDDTTRYEYVVHSGPYFATPEHAANPVLPAISVQFAMPDPNARYHIPLMIAPHSYSVWCSPPGG